MFSTEINVLPLFRKIEFSRVLHSVSKLCNVSYSISFNKTFVYIMKENEVVTCSTLMNNLYHIDCVMIHVDNVKKIIEKKRV